MVAVQWDATKPDHNEDSKVAKALVAILVFPVVKFVIFQSIPGLHLFNDQANMVLSIILLFFIAPAVRVAFRRNSRFIVTSFIILSSFLLFSLLFFSQNSKNILEHIFRIYFVSFTCLLLAFTLEDYKLFLQLLYRASFISIISGVLMVMSTSFIGVVGVAATEYNMSLSYYMVVPTLIMLLMYCEKEHKKALTFFVLGVLIIIAMGSRGPLLCILSFVFLYAIKWRSLSATRLLIYLLYLVTALAVVLYFENLVLWLYTELQEYNINSRTLQLILIGKLGAPSNRDLIAQEIVGKIVQHPFWGIGLLGDLTSHNIILETLLFYGVPAGSALLTILSLVIGKSLLYKECKELSLLILIFFSYAIPDALLNLTVWGKDMFWIYMGFSLTAFTKKQKKVGVSKL